MQTTSKQRSTATELPKTHFLRTLPATFNRILTKGKRGTLLTRELVSEAEIEVEDAQPSGHPPLRLITFILVVVIPFICSSLYYAFIASDQYTSEARFAVRSVADSGDNKVDGGSVVSMQSATQDSYIVTSFIQSPEMLKRIGAKIDYKSIFSLDDVDFLSRFDKNKSDEEFQNYWKDHVSAYIDGPSGIITLKIRTFRPEDSVKLVDAVVEQSEILVNELSQRARNDIIDSVSSEVKRTGSLYGNTLTALNTFQNGAGLLNPEVQAAETGKLITGLLARKLEIDNRLFVLKQSAAEKSPAYEQLTRAQEGLFIQISKLQSELTGAQNSNIAAALHGFSKLETDRLVAEKLYEAARNNYAAALNESLRKALYLVVFVHASMPQEALYPTRISTPLMILLGLLVLWSTLMLAWASVEDHRL
jgi:capsular polysaccharide transport system permease protein